MRDPSATGVRFRDLFKDREFSALYVADVFSRGGAQVGRFALAALVFDRTDSPTLAALTIAISYLPGLLGGPILSTLADRFPRRGLLAGCDVIRCLLIALIALQELPILVALGILLLVEFVRVPFGAARMAILADICEGERFTVGNALVSATGQVIQVVGFGLGGFVVAMLGSHTTLLANAGTYLLSAHILLLLVTPRPAPERPEGTGRSGLLSDTAEGFRVLTSTARLPPLFWLLLLGPAVIMTVEALAIPYAQHLDLGTRWAGVFMAAAPLGSAVGLALMARFSSGTRERILVPTCIAVGTLVACCALTTNPYVITALLVGAGMAMGNMAHLQALIVSLVASHVRGRIIGLGNTTLQVGQALAALTAGVVAENLTIPAVLLGAGLLGSVGVLMGAALRSPHGGKHRASPRQLRRQRRQSPVAEHEPEPSRGQAARGEAARGKTAREEPARGEPVRTAHLRNHLVSAANKPG